MRLYFLLFAILACFNLALADSVDIDCNDLYGECHKDSKADSNKVAQPPKSPNTSSGTNDNPFTHTPKKPPKETPQYQQHTGGFISSGAMPSLGGKKRGFLYSVVFLTALFDNGVQKQGYGILLQDGYVLGAANLLTEQNSYLKSVMAKMQDDSSNTLMCFAMLKLRATDSKLSLLRAENYTDIYCNTRPESFYHQRINLHYWTPIRGGVLKRTVLSNQDKVLYPFVTENNTLQYKSSGINAIQKRNAGYGLPLFNSGGNFVGFLHKTDDKKNANAIISSDEVRNFICDISRRKLLPIGDLVRSCLR